MTTVKNGRGKSVKAADLKIQFLKNAIAHFGAGAKFKNPEMLAFGRASKEFKKGSWNWIFDKKYRVGRGEYQIPDLHTFTKQTALTSVPLATERTKKTLARDSKDVKLQKVAKPVDSVKTETVTMLSPQDEAMANKILMRLGVSERTLKNA